MAEVSYSMNRGSVAALLAAAAGVVDKRAGADQVVLREATMAGTSKETGSWSPTSSFVRAVSRIGAFGWWRFLCWSGWRA